MVYKSLLMTTPIFNIDKSLQAVLFVANRLSRKDFHKIFKVLYFADREHLTKYGRPITGDTYIAMEYGPVPSAIYDIFKAVRGDGYQWEQIESVKKLFRIKDRCFIDPLQDANTDWLSESDISELNAALTKYGQLSWQEVINLSHAHAWSATPLNDRMSIEDIMRENGADAEFIADIIEDMRAAKEFTR